MTDAVRTMTRRRSTFLMAMWALGAGAPLAALGWWLWTPLFYLGVLLLILGATWLLCVPMVSREPLSPAHRRYLRTFFPAMGGYVLAIFVFGFLQHVALPTWVMILVALLPVLPMIWVVVTIWRYTRESDEMEQRIQLETVYLTCGVVGLLAFAAGMLEMAGVYRFEGGLFFVLPAMFLIYGIAGWWCRRKYGLKGMC
ncbi:MAG: hypothetical protein L0I62_06675 [Gammaproteobacteria bacterium]|nr:hypothetical protein [Gammaproteobacteria bacterium]